MEHPIVEVRFHPFSKYQIDLLTNDGQTGLTVTEAEKLIADLVKVVGKAYQEIYKEVA